MIGDGALLERALKYCIRKDISVELIIAKNNLSVKNIATKKELTFIQSRALNDTLHENLVNLAPTNVFSINNDQIISNDCLSLNHSFFNIHNGLVQNYRGIGEVCVFAAICNQERIYGATLQKLLPYFPPDTGPIVASSHFLVNSETDFYSLFKISLLNCQKLFEENVESILNNSYESHDEKILGRLYSFKDIVELVVNTDESVIRKAMALGSFEFFLPRLKTHISKALEIAKKN